MMNLLTARRRANQLILLGLLTIGCPPAFAQPDGQDSGVQYDNLGITNGLGFTLEEFFTSAISFSPELQIAQEQLNIGSARKRAATGRLLPQLNATANVSDNDRTSGDNNERYDGERYNVQLSQILFDWQQFASRRQAS